MHSHVHSHINADTHTETHIQFNTGFFAMRFSRNATHIVIQALAFVFFVTSHSLMFSTRTNHLTCIYVREYMFYIYNTRTSGLLTTQANGNASYMMNEKRQIASIQRESSVQRCILDVCYVHVCMHAYMRASIHVFLFVCMSVSMCTCMYG